MAFDVYGTPILTFRNSKIVYYGPHPCRNCGALIAKMDSKFGGTSFTYPAGPIYPNTEWHPHVCDPKNVAQYVPPVVNLNVPSTQLLGPLKDWHDKGVQTFLSGTATWRDVRLTT